MSPLETIQSKLAEFELELPPAPEAKGNYLPYVIANKMVYLSGTLPVKDGQLTHTGQVGDTQSIDTAYEAARHCLLNALANLKIATDDFTKLDRIVSVSGFVNSINGFADSPKVINGASDLLVAILGDQGKHARVAVSANGLPLNATVETQLVAALK